MKSLTIMIAAALCCTAFAYGAECGGAPQDGGRRGGMGMHAGDRPMMGNPILRAVSDPKAAEKLGLSEEQLAKLKEINNVGKSDREKQKKVREATMKQLELMKAGKIDEAAVMTAIDEIFQLRKEMAKAQAKRVIAVKSILTPEQIAKIHESMKDRPKAGDNRGPRRGGPQGGRRRKGGRGAHGDGAAPHPEAK